MGSDLDSMQAHLESLESLLDLMAVGNPQMQRMWRIRRRELVIPDPPSHPVDEETAELEKRTNTKDYFESDDVLNR